MSIVRIKREPTVAPTRRWEISSQTPFWRNRPPWMVIKLTTNCIGENRVAMDLHPDWTSRMMGATAAEELGLALSEAAQELKRL